jgi:hypothetical protein
MQTAWSRVFRLTAIGVVLRIFASCSNGGDDALNAAVPVRISPVHVESAGAPERVNEFETVVGGILSSVRAGKLDFVSWRLGAGGSVVAARWWRLGGAP